MKIDYKKMPDHMILALNELGEHEIAGPDDNDRILEYFKSTTYPADHDEVPWCAAYVNFILQESELPRTKSAAALSFREWGIKVKKPSIGDICVIDRGRGRGHVGFFMGFASNGNCIMLSGNTKDAVVVSEFKPNIIEQYRTLKSWKHSTTIQASAAVASVVSIPYIADLFGLDIELINSILSIIPNDYIDIVKTVAVILGLGYITIRKLRKLKEDKA